MAAHLLVQGLLQRSRRAVPRASHNQLGRTLSLRQAYQHEIKSARTQSLQRLHPACPSRHCKQQAMRKLAKR